MKKILLYFTCVFCVIFSSPQASAEGRLVEIVEFPVNINSESFNTETADKMLYYDYQMFLYKDIIYFPLSYYNCNLVGLKVSLEGETLMVKNDFTAAPAMFKRERLGEAVFNRSFVVKKVPFKVLLNGTEYQNEDYPILFYKNITYIPLTWQVVCDVFGWEFFFDENGMVLYTSSHYYISAGDSYFEKTESYRSSMVKYGKTYYCKDGVKIIAETTSNRLGPNSQNLSVTNEGVKHVIQGYTGHYQKEGPLFRVENGFLYTVHYEKNPAENKSCKISIDTGKIEYLE